MSDQDLEELATHIAERERLARIEAGIEATKAETERIRVDIERMRAETTLKKEKHWAEIDRLLDEWNALTTLAAVDVVMPPAGGALYTYLVKVFEETGRTMPAVSIRKDESDD